MKKSFLEDIQSDIPELSQAQTDKRMVLASKIDQSIKDKGYSIAEFAGVTGKKPALIKKWLSGTSNFDLDTIIELEHYLGVQFITLD